MTPKGGAVWARSARRVLGISIVALGSAAPDARAGSLMLGGSGWEAIWDASLDSLVDMSVDRVTAGAVFVGITSEFVEPSGPGGFPPISIVFRQVASPAADQIVIDDQVVANSTGQDWTGFMYESLDSGEALFNPELTNASGGGAGYSTSPLGNQTFGGDLTVFTVDGFGLGAGGGDAVIRAADVWFPGLGGGELYINVTPHEQAPYALFTLRQTPVPEPTTAALLIGATALLRCRRYGLHRSLD